MLPGLVGVGNRASAPVAGHDRADTRRRHWIALVVDQAEEGGMSSQCSCTGLRHDPGTERIAVDSPEGFGLALGGRLKHSQLGTRETCSAADIDAGLRRSESAMAHNLKC